MSLQPSHCHWVKRDNDNKMKNMLHACADYTLAHSLNAPTNLSDGINNLIMECVHIVMNHHLLLESNNGRCRVGPA